MLVALAGYLNNYNGTFDFTSASAYPEWVNYVGIRMFLASFGALAVPFAFMTAIAMNLSPAACTLVAVCMLFDNGLVGISRLILLDSMLLFFTVSSTLGLALFNRFRDRPFSLKWYLALFWTGLNIGLVSSVKWVGLFGVAMVGLHTIRDLWLSLPLRSSKHIAKDLASRALFLIALPLAVYAGSFYIHFLILNHSGPGDAQMSSLFQAGLIGSDISKSPFEVAYGSQVTLRNQVAGGPLLHSHVQTYPEGSRQQQVTGYYHKDVNNDFIFQRDHSYDPTAEGHDPSEIQFIKNGDILRLVHSATFKNLHSHRVLAHVTKADFEVTGYGNDTVYKDPNDHWQIEVVEDSTDVANPEERIRSLGTSFRLRHVTTGCYLSSGRAFYPEWGFNQLEVTCQRELDSGSHLLWNVETHVNDLLPPGTKAIYRSSFLRDFIDVNINMWRTNNALVADQELEPSALTSSAHEWPFLMTGIRMTSFDDNTVKFYMGGNPLIWWLTGAAIVFSLASLLLYALCQKRGITFVVAPTLAAFNLYIDQLQLSSFGWLLHFVPFFVMGRVLYLHHYYPALFFAILSLATLFDRAFVIGWPNAKPWSARIVFGLTALTLPIIATFVLFAPICYGIEGPSAQIDYLRWISAWKL